MFSQFVQSHRRWFDGTTRVLEAGLAVLVLGCIVSPAMPAQPMKAPVYMFAVGGLNITLSSVYGLKRVSGKLEQFGALNPGRRLRKGSLLEKMLEKAKRWEKNHPERVVRATERARTCNCDALVIQDYEGAVQIVRNLQPPKQQTVFGKSLVIDALKKPSMPKVVHFENFSPESVEGIARSISPVPIATRGRMIDGLLKDPASGARKGGSSGDNFSMMVEQPGNRHEVVHISGKSDAHALFSESVAWGTGRVEPATAKTWAEAFGQGQRLINPNRAIIVQFDGGKSKLGIMVGANDANRPGFLAQLIELVRSWLAKRRSNTSSIGDGIVDLREQIRQQLKPQDLKFFYQRNAKVIRAAELVHPVDRGRTSDRRG